MQYGLVLSVSFNTIQAHAAYNCVMCYAALCISLCLCVHDLPAAGKV